MSQKLLLKLAHINDPHSHFEPSRVQLHLQLDEKNITFFTHTGGYARIKAQLTKAKCQAEQAKQKFLFLHGGDSFQGTLYFREFKGLANADLLNMLGPDAMVLGNHEIDGGNEPVRNFLDKINFPLLAGNMDLSHEPKTKYALQGHKRLYDYDPTTGCAKALIQQFEEHQLAIFGITLDKMLEIARPDPGTDFLDAIEVTRRTVSHLQQQGIKHIIVLSHLGIDGDRLLASKIDGISLIVGGHSHTLQGDFSDLGLSDMPYGEQINGIPILHAGKYAETLGLADIEFDHLGKVISCSGNNFFMLDKQFTKASGKPLTQIEQSAIEQCLTKHSGILWDEMDLSVQQRINNKYRPKIDALAEQIVALVPKELVHSRLPSKLLPNGSQLAPWVSRAMYQAAKVCDSRIDFALHNAGGVRQSLEPGKLTMADIIGRILPFELPLVKYQIRGRYLYEVIESAINAATNNSVMGTGTGSFPYTYGLRFNYDGRKPLGHRITKLEVMQKKHWRPVNPDEIYTGVSTEYTASGKEGYAPLLNFEWSQVMDNLTLPSAFADFIALGDVWNKPLNPNVQYISHKFVEQKT